MGRYSVIAGQNIFDVALHLYGSIEGIVDLMMNNPDLSLDTTLTVGQELVYTDGFVINADVVAYNAARGIVPANGEHHVYPKYPEGQLSVEFHLPAAVLNVSCTASGTGSLEIDWGDNSEIEKIELRNARLHLNHTFDNTIKGTRRIRWYSRAEFKTLDWSGLQPDSIFLFHPLRVEELTLQNASVSLEGLRLLDGTYSLRLSGITTADLTPLAGCRELMTLDMGEGHLKPDVEDAFLYEIVNRYGNRRNCTVTFPVTPSGIYREPDRDPESARYLPVSGMECIWVILHEESWNEGGPWKFIIETRWLN